MVTYRLTVSVLYREMLFWANDHIPLMFYVEQPEAAMCELCCTVASAAKKSRADLVNAVPRSSNSNVTLFNLKVRFHWKAHRNFVFKELESRNLPRSKI